MSDLPVGSTRVQPTPTQPEPLSQPAERTDKTASASTSSVSSGMGEMGNGLPVSTLPPVAPAAPNPPAQLPGSPTVSVQELMQNSGVSGETASPQPLADRVSVYGRFNFGGLYFNNGEASGFRAVNNDTMPTTLRVVAERDLPGGVTLQGRGELWVVGGSFGSIAVTPDGYGTGLPVYPAAAEITLSQPKLGKLSLGQGSTATDFAAQLPPNLGPIITIGNAMRIDGTFGRDGEALTLGAVANDLDGPRAPRLRYDTPSLGGFTLSGSIATEKNPEGALRYAGNWGPFAVKTAFGYAHEEAGDRLMASAVISEQKTGLYLSGSGGGRIVEGAADPHVWFAQTGVQGEKLAAHAWHGEYDNFAGDSNASRTGGMLEYKPIKGVSFYIEGDYWRVTDAQNNQGSLTTVVPGIKLEFGDF